jgi:hypothetical protein
MAFSISSLQRPFCVIVAAPLFIFHNYCGLLAFSLSLPHPRLCYHGNIPGSSLRIARRIIMMVSQWKKSLWFMLESWGKQSNGGFTACHCMAPRLSCHDFNGRRGRGGLGGYRVHLWCSYECEHPIKYNFLPFTFLHRSSQCSGSALKSKFWRVCRPLVVDSHHFDKDPDPQAIKWKIGSGSALKRGRSATLLILQCM